MNENIEKNTVENFSEEKDTVKKELVAESERFLDNMKKLHEKLGDSEDRESFLAVWDTIFPDRQNELLRHMETEIDEMTFRKNAEKAGHEILKTNLHFHTGDDPMDPIAYSTKEGIDYAAEHGFNVLAITCHQKFAWTEEYKKYAEEKGILLISGIEINVDEDTKKWGRHVLVLNATPDAEKVKTFAELEQYETDHPDAFVIAPHPYFYGAFNLSEFLEKYISLFDAIEHSWFYSELSNRNEKAAEVAKAHQLPFVATSDTHLLDFIDTNYCVIEVDKKTPEAVFKAIREQKFLNVSTPPNFIRDMIFREGLFAVKTIISRMVGEKGDFHSSDI
jgi:hypothetical protein